MLRVDRHGLRARVARLGGGEPERPHTRTCGRAEPQALAADARASRSSSAISCPPGSVNTAWWRPRSSRDPRRQRLEQLHERDGPSAP